MKNSLINVLNKLPYVRGLYTEVKHYQDNCFAPPGHYYSPIMERHEVMNDADRIWKKTVPADVKGIDFNEAEQVSLLASFASYYNDIPFQANKQPNLRYYFDNKWYSYTDAIILYSFMRHFKPKRIIEVGSGYSSAVMLDTRDRFELDVELSFVEPYTERLMTLLEPKDKTRSNIMEKRVQDVPLEYFKSLEENDILFIDSSHVSKIGSDVNYLLLEVIPNLKKGVLIHIHDIFYPFEYPKDWIFEMRRNWNELYMMRAFLMFNNSFKIRFFSDYMHQFHADGFKDMPLCNKHQGHHLWIQKTQ